MVGNNANSSKKSYMKILPSLPAAAGEIKKRISKSAKRRRALHFIRCRRPINNIDLARTLCMNFEGFKKPDKVKDSKHAMIVLNAWNSALCDGKLIRVSDRINYPRQMKPSSAPYGSTKSGGVDFYMSAPWRRLRMKVLEKSNGKCSCCGRSKTSWCGYTCGSHQATVHTSRARTSREQPASSL